mmetsp:Transcript_19141/g.44596  ORF Transcript_19141/g.44596 Transcript_19141/m.44596 type:complete len:578 (+) Transcript_19141:14-1747(+)
MLRALAILAAAAAATAHPMWTRVGRAPSTEVVDFTVATPMTNEAQLLRFVDEVSDPTSPNYGKFLSKDEVNAMTATPRWMSNAVLVWLHQHGHSCTPRSDSIKCRGTVANVERMLSTRLNSYKHTKSGDLVHRVDGDYTFPAEMVGKVEFISGLHGFPVEHLGRAHFRRDSQGRKLQAQQYVVPETISNLYGLKGASGSASVTQAAAEFQDYPAFATSDLTTFIQQTAVPSFSIAKTIGPFDQSNPQPESTLDVQYLGAVGTGNTNWYWTEAGWMFEFSQDLLNAGASGSPNIISMSYGWSEADQCQISPSSGPCQAGGSAAFVTRTNSEFAKVAATGITLLASSGDSGAHGRTDPLCQNAVLSPTYPAASPYVLAVGATMISSASAQTGGSSPFCQSNTCLTGGTEIVCSPAQGALIASGGGFSNVAPRPAYQDAQVAAFLKSNGVPPTGDYNSTGRGYPDVAALGHSYYIELSGEAMAVDGTSCSSPVFAGVVGLLAAKKGGPLGHVAPLLYKIYEKDNSAFTDITSGNNFCTETTCDCTDGYTAVKGWDAASGLGTPVFPKMVSAMQAILAARK